MADEPKPNLLRWLAEDARVFTRQAGEYRNFFDDLRSEKDMDVEEFPYLRSLFRELDWKCVLYLDRHSATVKNFAAVLQAITKLFSIPVAGHLLSSQHFAKNRPVLEKILQFLYRHTGFDGVFESRHVDFIGLRPISDIPLPKEGTRNAYFDTKTSLRYLKDDGSIYSLAATKGKGLLNKIACDNMHICTRLNLDWPAAFALLSQSVDANVSSNLQLLYKQLETYMAPPPEPPAIPLSDYLAQELATIVGVEAKDIFFFKVDYDFCSLNKYHALYSVCKALHSRCEPVGRLEKNNLVAIFRAMMLDPFDDINVGRDLLSAKRFAFNAGVLDALFRFYQCAAFEASCHIPCELESGLSSNLGSILDYFAPRSVTACTEANQLVDAHRLLFFQAPSGVAIEKPLYELTLQYASFYFTFPPEVSAPLERTTCSITTRLLLLHASLNNYYRIHGPNMLVES